MCEDFAAEMDHPETSDVLDGYYLCNVPQHDLLLRTSM